MFFTILPLRPQKFQKSNFVAHFFVFKDTGMNNMHLQFHYNSLKLLRFQHGSSTRFNCSSAALHCHLSNNGLPAERITFWRSAEKRASSAVQSSCTPGWPPHRSSWRHPGQHWRPPIPNRRQDVNSMAIHRRLRHGNEIEIQKLISFSLPSYSYYIFALADSMDQRRPVYLQHRLYSIPDW